MSSSAPSESRPVRSPRQVKAAAGLLQKEARRIVKRHSARMGPTATESIQAAIAAIDTHRAGRQWAELEQNAELLDELLQTHARFARKSALWETLENVLLAVGVALGLRSCFYEPFKIPSGSMKPTLREGDHIFVNKFRYGVQIPFTTTILAPDLVSEIERGEVIVFRFPLDQSEDFIKRVIGLPGDSIRVDDGDLFLRRAGETEFEQIVRQRLDTPCEDMPAGCALFEETLDDRRYVVRYLTDDEPHSDQRDRTVTVPPGHLFVMGDNRNESMDSLQWQGQVEAVAADRLLSMKDLRDLTSEAVFSVIRPSQSETESDPHHDRIEYLANRRAPEHDLRLEVWRSPSLGAKAVFAGAVAELGESEVVTVEQLLDRSTSVDSAVRSRAAEVGVAIDALVTQQDAQSWTAVFMLEPSDVVFRLQCGTQSCANAGALAVRIADVLRRYQREPTRSTRELIDADPEVRYTRHWRSRELQRERFLDATFVVQGDSTGTPAVRLRAWRRPEEGATTVRSAALAALGATKDTAESLAAHGADAWRVPGETTLGYVLHDPSNESVLLLECARAYCQDATAGANLMSTVAERLSEAAADRRKLRSLITAADVPGLEEHEVHTPDVYEWERISLDATVRGGDYAVSLEAWRAPAAGLDAVLATWRNQLKTSQPRDDLRAGALVGEDGDGYRAIVPVRETDVAISIECRSGLCPDEEVIVALAERVISKALDTSLFVDAAALRARPFVPRGNVKGRAERIWLPLHRFWRPIE